MAAVLGHQLVLARESPECLFADLNPGQKQLAVLESRVPQSHLEILAPVVERLRHREAVVELLNGPNARGIAQAQHIGPGIQPDRRAGALIALLIFVVAGLHLVIKELKARLVRPPPLPEGDQADPDPVPLGVVTDSAPLQERTSHLLGRQRALAELLQPAAIQIQAEAAQLVQ